METRRRIVTLAESFIDCGMGNDWKRYLDLIGPDETKEMRDSMATMSGCALVIRGMWRLLGVRHPRLAAPYKIGAAIADLMTVAYERKAVASVSALPKPGDVMLVGGGADGGGYEHVFTVVGADEDFDVRGKARVTSVDGGQKDDKGKQVIRLKHRVWTRIGSTIYDSTHEKFETPPRAVGRKARKLIDADRMGFPESDEITEPDLSAARRW